MPNRRRPDATLDKSLIAELRQFDLSLEKAMSQRNLKAVMAAFWKSPQLVVFPAMGAVELQGWDAVHDYYERLLSTNIISFECPEAHYQLLSPEAAAGWGRWKMTTQVGRKQESMIGRYTRIYGLIEERWVYVIDHASLPVS